MCKMTTQKDLDNYKIPENNSKALLLFDEGKLSSRDYLHLSEKSFRNSFFSDTIYHLRASATIISILMRIIIKKMSKRK